jgi:hypothetical protein
MVQAQPPTLEVGYEVCQKRGLLRETHTLQHAAPRSIEPALCMPENLTGGRAAATLLQALWARATQSFSVLSTLATSHARHLLVQELYCLGLEVWELAIIWSRELAGAGCCLGVDCDPSDCTRPRHARQIALTLDGCEHCGPEHLSVVVKC